MVTGSIVPPPSLHPGHSRARLSSRWIVALMGVALITAAIVGVGFAHPRMGAGPLGPRADNRALEGAVRAPGHPVSFGVISFDAYDARTPVVLESARPVSSPAGLR